MIIFIVLVVLFILVTVSIVLLRRAGGGSFPWFHFYTKGKEAGFSFKEVNLLRKVAVENRLSNPTSLFWSVKLLDRSIRGMIIRFVSEGTLNNEDNVYFLSKLFEFRKTVEMNLPKYKIGLKTTRKIPARQHLKITLTGVGTYHSQVVENQRRYIAISYPEGPKLPPGFEFKGQRIGVYFWRQEDAGYVFESKVLEDFSDRKYPLLYISHSDSLVRSQKRNSIRVPLNNPAYLFPLKHINQASEEIETGRGLRCRLQDISEDGAAVYIGGRARVGLSVKLQFKLSDSTIIMNGVVKGVNFHQRKNASVIHIQAVPPSKRMTNRILAYVYNIFGERDSKGRRNAGSVPEGW